MVHPANLTANTEYFCVNSLLSAHKIPATSYKVKLTSTSASDDDFLRSAFVLRRASDVLVTATGGTLVVLVTDVTVDVLGGVVHVVTGLVTLLSSYEPLLLLLLAACNDAPAFSTSSFVTP